VYRRFFVADGNFKADHVRQKNVSDVWLSEGAGMFAKRSEYEDFLRTATERLTVSNLHVGMPWCGAEGTVPDMYSADGMVPCT
jgi:hypothetical protein